MTENTHTDVDTESAELDPVDIETADPIVVICQGNCDSLSGRSTITFEIGKHTDDGSLHIRISGNSAAGMFCKDWVSSDSIHDIVLAAFELNAACFHPLYEGRSINTAGFLLAALKELCLVRPGEENTRLHEHVPTTTFASVVKDYMAAVSKTPKRKTKET